MGKLIRQEGDNRQYDPVKTYPHWMSRAFKGGFPTNADNDRFGLR